MNRVEFMTDLAILLRDVPEAERKDAMQYYNDYFDDAGAANEQQVIKELESPEKVAATIKANLNIQEDSRDHAEAGAAQTEMSGGGEKEQDNNRQENKKDGYAYQYSGSVNPEGAADRKTESGRTLKIVLAIALIVVAAPVVIPLALGIVIAALALIAAAVVLLATLVIGFVMVGIMGIMCIFSGLAALIPEIAVGLALIGTGLILGVIGAVGTVGSVKLCLVLFPAMFRGIVWLCRKPFERKAVA